jgi:hypothetical protein
MPECNDLRGAKISVLVFGALAFTVMPGLAQKAARQRQLDKPVRSLSSQPLPVPHSSP